MIDPLDSAAASPEPHDASRFPIPICETHGSSRKSMEDRLVPYVVVVEAKNHTRNGQTALRREHLRRTVQKLTPQKRLLFTAID